MWGTGERRGTFGGSTWRWFLGGAKEKERKVSKGEVGGSRQRGRTGQLGRSNGVNELSKILSAEWRTRERQVGLGELS